MVSAKEMAHQISEVALDFLLPPICYKCRIPLSETNQICSSCWQDINFITQPFCAVKGTPLPFSISKETISAAAIANPPVYRRARSVAEYQGTMRDLIHQFKYHDNHELSDLFATWLERAGAELLHDCDLLIPIPLYRWRLWQRRFNQAAMLSYALANLTGHDVVCDTLIRTKKTKPQVGLTSKERERNIQGAFQIRQENQKKIANKTILLIDDIVTTGVTANTAAKVLIKAGAANVDLLSLASVSQETQLLP